MILGIGIDSAPIRPIEEQFRKDATSFFTGTFTAREIEYCETAVSEKPAQHFAGRLAVKESFIKALGQVMVQAGRPERMRVDDYLQIEVVIQEGGHPTITLHGRILEIAESVGVNKTWTSITHDENRAIAVVVLEGKKPGTE